MSSYQKIKDLCEQNNWELSLFERYFKLIEHYNSFMNLTGFKGERLWEEGILESLMFMLEITKNKENISILDIGAGAGFPSIPYILTKPTNKITIYEPIQKRVDFLNIVIEQLDLSDYVSVFRTRSEEVKEKNLFDIVTARAVADVRSLLMSSFHLVKVKGSMILLKSNQLKSELTQAQDVLAKLDYNLKIQELSQTSSTRNNFILYIEKQRSTNSEFPFAWKNIKSKK
ncbi:16S rRNA (guanine(527)-N(7))-methyltransferase RsmG [Mycoplasma leonicaptivi]|uniref:16S rRNA (guanine(527)-N(7))-methyltransferase RsmG n=1 Tax=Mycoplasma leonicaptivi TaxID=36742 RepID=UPI000AD6F892